MDTRSNTTQTLRVLGEDKKTYLKECFSQIATAKQMIAAADKSALQYPAQSELASDVIRDQRNIINKMMERAKHEQQN